MRLCREDRKDARVTVTVTRRRVRRHHIDVTPTRYIPKMGAPAARQHDRQRLIVVRAVLFFEGDRIHRHSSKISWYYFKNRTTEAAELSMRCGQTRSLSSRSQPKMSLRRLVNEG